MSAPATRCRACNARLDGASPRCRTCGTDASVDPFLLVVGDRVPPSPAVDAGPAATGRRWRDLAVVVSVLVLVVALLTRAGSPDGTTASAPTGGDGAPADHGARPGEGRVLPTTARRDGGAPFVGDGPRFYGPLLPVQTGLRLVTLTEGVAHLVDLDTGELSLLDVDGAGPFRSVTTVGRAVVLVGDSGHALAVSAEPGAAPVPLGRGDVVASPASARVWLVNRSSTLRGDARQVRLDGVVTVPRFRLPDGHRPVGAVPGGLVVAGPDKNLVVRGDGVARAAPEGEILAAGSEAVARVACDGNLGCRIRVTPLRGGTDLPLAVPAEFGLGGSFSPSGDHLALVVRRGRRAPLDVSVHDLNSGTNRSLLGSHDLGDPAPAWSPGSDWLFFAVRDGLAAFNVATSETYTLAVGDVGSDGIAVLGPPGVGVAG